ncbi:chaplin [Streptomyces celluloflavus]|uniref:chaplin n=1 Tax=Streptomyces celluloflavus TaxID=58344 RepID=UPI0036AB207C
MRQSLKRSVLVVAAASGALGVSGGPVYADAGAVGDAARSPGVLSGNSVEVAVHAPVTVCGNSVAGVGALNPGMGNSCGDGGRGAGGGRHRRPGGDAVHGGPRGATARGGAARSPGVLSGNAVQAPVHLPVGVCGNTVAVVGLLQPAGGTSCGNGERSGPAARRPPVAQHPQVVQGPQVVRGATARSGRPGPMARAVGGPERGPGATARAAVRAGAGEAVGQVGPVLAETGAYRPGAMAGAGAGVLLGGALLLRRCRTRRR